MSDLLNPKVKDNGYKTQSTGSGGAQEVVNSSGCVDGYRAVRRKLMVHEMGYSVRRNDGVIKLLGKLTENDSRERSK